MGNAMSRGFPTAQKNLPGCYTEEKGLHCNVFRTILRNHIIHFEQNDID